MDNETNNTQNVQQAVTTALDNEKKKKKKKKWIIIAVVVLALIIIVAAFGSSSDTDSSSDQNTDPVSSAQSAKEPEEKKIEAGNAVESNDLKITYISCDADYKKYNSYIPPKNGNKIIRAEFEFENKSSVDQLISGAECYADDAKCDAYFGADDSSFSTANTVSPGRSVKASVYYEVPKDAKDIELEIAGNFWSNEKIIFVVK